MIARTVMDVQHASGNAGGTKPWLSIPRFETVDQVVLDTTVAGFAAVGKILVEDMTAANSAQATATTCGPSFKLSAVANQAIPPYGCGVVVSPGGANATNASGLANQAAPNQQQARIASIGDVLAFATTTANTNKAIAVGDPLALDGAGNLTSCPATPATGTVVAVAKQALAGGTGTATLIAVRMGGY